MASPDRTKKKVNQTGYDDPNVAPFSDNYQDLYRGMLLKYRTLYEKFDEVVYYIERLEMVRLNNLSDPEEIRKLTYVVNKLKEIAESEDDERV